MYCAIWRMQIILMQLTIGNIFTADTLEQMVHVLPRLRWSDGQRTAGSAARSVKKNRQADVSRGVGRQLTMDISEAIHGHPVILAAARPKRISPILLSRTEKEGGYGPHLDNAILGKPPSRMRGDLSFTLFLSDPDDYDGGELVVHETARVESHKPGLGDLVLYPAGEIHEVKPVTRGVRYAAVGWIESMIRDAHARAILFDLENLKVSLQQQGENLGAEQMTVNKIIGNLLRRWGDL